MTKARKKRVLVLAHEEFVPPDTIEGLSDEEVHPFKMEYDIVRALEVLGHEVQVLGVQDELRPIREAIDRFEPHIAFNCLRYFHDIGGYDAHVVSYLELLKVAYTGSNPRGLLLANDKALSKKILNYHRIRTPGFAVFQMGDPKRKLPSRLRFPMIVKTLAEHASVGISQASVVEDEAALRARVAYVHETIGRDAIAEEYVEGRELTIGVLGNRRLSTFPVFELQFDRLPSGARPIATERVKTDFDYQERVGVRTGPAEELTDAQRQAISRTAKRIYRALDLSGFARIDLRLEESTGDVYVLEANPNPDLSYGEDFAESSEKTGLKYEKLIAKILGLGLAYRPAWKQS
ncbi:MAG: ATP-grasp domain-containing protein [Planctomycetota bacterium]